MCQIIFIPVRLTLPLSQLSHSPAQITRPPQLLCPDHLAERADFKAILQKEVAAHKLVYDDPWSCVKKIYHEVSKHAHENTEPIVLDRRYFTPNELVVLTAFFRVQEK